MGVRLERLFPCRDRVLALRLLQLATPIIDVVVSSCRPPIFWILGLLPDPSSRLDELGRSQKKKCVDCVENVKGS